MNGAKAKRGSVLVELSLVFLIWAILLIGIVDMAQCLYFQQSLVERVRMAARWGAVTDPSDAAAIRNMVLYLQPTRPADGRAPSFGLAESMVSVTAADAQTENYRLVVEVSGYSFRMLSPLLPRNYTGTMVRTVVPLGAY